MRQPSPARDPPPGSNTGLGWMRRAGIGAAVLFVGLAIGGVPAVLIAAYLVKSMPLEYVRWLVIIVVVYTAITMLRSAMSEKPAT